MLGLPSKYSFSLLFWCQFSLLDWAFHHSRAIRTTKDFWVIFFVWPWTTGEAINIYKRNATMEPSCNFYNLLLECEMSPGENPGVRKSGSGSTAGWTQAQKHGLGLAQSSHTMLWGHLALISIFHWVQLHIFFVVEEKKKILLQKQLPSPCWLSLH